MISLREIDIDNYLECMGLQVTEEQKEFVASNAFSLAQSKYLPECIPLAIYHGELMIGFLMHGVDRDDDHHWIWRLMIDKLYQGNHYGKEALRLLIEKLEEEEQCRKIRISFDPSNKAAEHLYESLGFYHTGAIVDGETVMEKNLKLQDTIGA